MILAWYNLFTRRQHYGETFDDWLCELRKLYDIADGDDIKRNDLMTVLITTGNRDETLRSKILEDLRNSTLDDTVKLIGKMVYAKDTNARIEKRREDSKIALISNGSSNRKPSKTSYQKDKEIRTFDKHYGDKKFKTSEKRNNKCY